MTARSPTFDDVNTAAVAAYPGLLSQLFPKGHLCGREFCVGNLQGEPGESLSVNVETGVWKDFATGDKGSDPVGLFAAINGFGQVEAKDQLAQLLGLTTNRKRTHRQHQTSKPRSNGRRHRQKAIPKPELDDRTRVRIEMALSIWKDSEPAPGTVVEKYLHGRGIDVEIPPSIRFHPHLKHGPTGLRFPAMVVAVQILDRRITAIHRTFLLPDGRGKAQVSEPKMALGLIGVGAVHLAATTEELVLAEGIETGLSVLQATGKPVWACLGTSGLKAVILPPEVKTVIIAADADEAGEKAAQDAARRFYLEGRDVKIARPPAGMDWNDVLQLPDNVTPLWRR
jgi:hypothetical protein